MTKKNNLISDVFEDFRGKVGKRAKPIIFSKKYQNQQFIYQKRLEQFITHQILALKKAYLYGQKKFTQKK